jgi:predicted choloylglycine hydrolase
MRFQKNINKLKTEIVSAGVKPSSNMPVVCLQRGCSILTGKQRAFILRNFIQSYVVSEVYACFQKMNSNPSVYNATRQ